MHNPDALHHRVFVQELEGITKGQSVESCVRSTTKVLTDEERRAHNETHILDLLRYLKLRDRPFAGDRDAWTSRQVLETAYTMIQRVTLYQMKASWGWRGQVLRLLGRIFQVGVGPGHIVDDTHLVFPVFAWPRCPVVTAYGSHLSACGQACKERSRSGVFTNALVSRVLTFYHPGLKLRLRTFREKAFSACIYEIVLERG